MARMPMRLLLIRWAAKRENKLGYKLSDRKTLLGTHKWAAHTDNDIRAYIQLLDEKLKVQPTTFFPEV